MRGSVARLRLGGCPLCVPEGNGWYTWSERAKPWSAERRKGARNEK